MMKRLSTSIGLLLICLTLLGGAHGQFRTHEYLISERLDAWHNPIAGILLRSFEAPPHPYAAGHRGLDVLVHPEAQIQAPFPGLVVFSGLVAGRPVVVLQHQTGLRFSVEPAFTHLAVGTFVLAGHHIAVVATDYSRTSHCFPELCVHWGIRHESTYLNPTILLQRHRVRLVH